MHNSIDIGKKDITPFLAVDFPAMMGLAVSSLFQIWISPRLWLVTGAIFTFIFACTIVNQRSPADALRYSAHSALASVLLCSLAPLSGAYLTAVAAFKWVCFWLALWWPIYILAWFPTMGSFPPTGMSVLEMDQIVALLTIVVVATVRGLRSVWKARHFLSRFTTDSPHELSHPLPRKSHQPAAGEEVDITDINIYEVDNPVQI
jgi:hypothetical protein